MASFANLFFVQGVCFKDYFDRNVFFVAYVDNGKVVLKGDSPRVHGRKAEGPSKTFAQHMGKHFPYSNAERAIVSGAKGRSQA